MKKDMQAALAFAAAVPLFALIVFSTSRGFVLLDVVAIHDPWAVVAHLMHINQGDYSLELLLSPHNEHRLATTRIAMILDAQFNAFRGELPVVISYTCMAAIAFIVSIAAFRDSVLARVWLMPLALEILAIALGLSQRTLFGQPFNVQYALVHFFAAATIVAAVRMSMSAKPLTWLPLVLLFDLLGILSLGSGMFAGLAVAGIYAAKRRVDLAAVLFFVLHVVLSAAYLYGIQRESPSAFNPIGAIRTLFETLGLVSFDSPMLVGAVLTASYLALSCIVLWSGWRSKRDDNWSLALVGLGGFALVEAAAVAWSRADFGGANARYDNVSIVFTLATLGLLWRIVSRQKYGSVAAALTTLALVLMANDVRDLADWERWASYTGQIEARLVSGERSPDLFSNLWPQGNNDWLPKYIDFMQERSIGPFAAPF